MPTERVFLDLEQIKLLVPATIKAKKNLSCQRQCLCLQVKYTTNSTSIEIIIKKKKKAYFYWKHNFIKFTPTSQSEVP